MPSLRPGDYSISAESAGFQKTVRTGITLQVAQVARVDIALQAARSPKRWRWSAERRCSTR